MAMDWNLVSTIAVPFLCLFFGAFVNRKLERRPVIVSFFGHASSFSIKSDEGNVLGVNTHTVVIRNVGKRSAVNLRMTHAILPNINVFPQIPYHSESLPGGAVDLVFPTIVPGQQITVSYLYLAPLLVTGVNMGIKHDDGFGKVISVILQRQFPLWLLRVTKWSAIIGAVTVLYGLVKACIYFAPLTLSILGSI